MTYLTFMEQIFTLLDEPLTARWYKGRVEAIQRQRSTVGLTVGHQHNENLLE
jgi:hypothetical protein